MEQLIPYDVYTKTNDEIFHPVHYRKYFGGIVGVLRQKFPSLSETAIEDYVQDAFFQYYIYVYVEKKVKEKFEAKGQQLAWVKKTAVNDILDFIDDKKPAPFKCFGNHDICECAGNCIYVSNIEEALDEHSEYDNYLNKQKILDNIPELVVEETDSPSEQYEDDGNSLEKQLYMKIVQKIKLNETEKILLKEHWQKKKTIKKIAEKLNVSYESLDHKNRRLIQKFRNKFCEFATQVELNEQEKVIVEKYWRLKVAAEKLAEEFGISEQCFLRKKERLMKKILEFAKNVQT